MAETPGPGVVTNEVDTLLPAFEGNGCQVLGKIDLPELPSVVWFRCTFPNCGGRDFREEEAILPNLGAIATKLGRDNILPEDLKGVVICRYHANLLEDKGVRCYRYLKTLGFLERRAEDAKGLDAFLGGRHTPNNVRAPWQQETPPVPLKVRVEIPPRGRDFDSPAAQKPVGRRGQGKNKNRGGWADRD